jgi:hypothetical protein
MFKLITGILHGEPIDSPLLQEGYKMYEGKRIEITLRRYSDRRTNPQNRFYWGVLLPMIANYARELGEDVTKEEWHEYYVQKGYFGWEAKIINGEEVRLPRRSPEALTIDFNEVFQRLQREWAQRGLYLPDPNEEPTHSIRIKQLDPL